MAYYLPHQYVEQPPNRFQEYDDRAQERPLYWQREVYRHAGEIFLALPPHTVNTIADFGCGIGAKLYRLHSTVGSRVIGYEPNPEVIEWIEEQQRSSGQSKGKIVWTDNFTCFRNAAREQLVICADVIEHVSDPIFLLQKLRHLHAHIYIISTVAREILHSNAEHNGPPSNRGHWREWSTQEFLLLLSSQGFGVLRTRHTPCDATQYHICRIN